MGDSRFAQGSGCRSSKKEHSNREKLESRSITRDHENETSELADLVRFC